MAAAARVQVYLMLNILGGYMIQPLLIFAQTKFFNSNHDCVSDEQVTADLLLSNPCGASIMLP